jgi:hypothetical protein
MRIRILDKLSHKNLRSRIETNADPDPAFYQKKGIQIRVRIQGAKPMRIRILDRLSHKNIVPGQEPCRRGAGSSWQWWRQSLRTFFINRAGTI